MAKIDRKNQRIFGSTAVAGQIGVFGSFAAGSVAYSTDPEVIQALSNWIDGWYAAVVGENSPAIQDMNAFMYVSTYQLAYLFQAGMAEWDDATTYYTGSYCQSAGRFYKSLADDNLNQALTDPTKWQPQDFLPTGAGMQFWGTTIPTGWVLADGRTIGSSGSGATNRANADTYFLYSLLWASYSNTILVIEDSSGTPTTRGATAAADFAANKRMPIIDMRGRVAAGRDDMGGSAASRLTNTTMTPDGVTLGAVGGTQTHTLITAEIPAHNHTQSAHGHAVYGEGGGGGPLTNLNNGSTQGLLGDSGNNTLGYYTNVQGGGGVPFLQQATPAIQNTGGDGAHLNVQPTIICNYCLKL